MLFNSIEFLFFFPIVVLVYFILPKRIKQYWLLISSYFFYMCWNVRYAALIFFSTVVTYFSGIILDKIKQYMWNDCRKLKYEKLVVACGFSLNLLVLFYFKYINFVFDIVNSLFRAIHLELYVPAFDIILPVGISFYTFQALSYTMDVYRGEINAERNFFRYALFVSFFPQLVAGPIERSKNLLKQLEEPKKFNVEMAENGILLMLWGYFLKIVLADRIAIFVDTVYSEYTVYAGWYLIVATMLFAIQIYCDFYGYSVIAMGAASILGIHLMENFNAPYLSTSVAEFWRRWHISLTSWLKDYLYIPLGGGRKGNARKYLNKLCVFLVSGLWHGAEMSFVIWGGINGLYQIIGEVLKPARDKIVSLLHLNRETLGHKLLQMTGTFLLVDFSWIFFRAKKLEDAFEIIKQMFCIHNPWILFDSSLYNCGLDIKNFELMLICICILFFADCCRMKKIRIREIVSKQDSWFKCIFVASVTWFVITFGVWGSVYSEANFIYFQF